LFCAFARLSISEYFKVGTQVVFEQKTENENKGNEEKEQSN